jgi:molybdopterin/thiamine biosynthesis adenylyltransferase
MQMKMRMAKATWERLRSYHFSPGKRVERLSFLWARAYQDGLANITVIVSHDAPMFLFADDCYSHQSGANCRLLPEVLNGMLVQFAASDYNTLINVHDHWFDETTHFSSIDDTDDLEFDKYLRERFKPMLKKHRHIGPDRDILNISIVLAKRGCEARVINSKQKNPFSPLASLDVLGDYLKRVYQGRSALRAKKAQNLQAFCRHRDFISKKQQRLMSHLTVALIGCGGIGAILCEALLRTGFGAIAGIILIDDDRLEESNLNRFQGGKPRMVGKSKAYLLARQLRAMFPGHPVKAISQSVYHPDAEAAIRCADILVGGLDNDEARYFLNRVALQYYLPYFDAATAITGKNAKVDFLTRYFAVIPGVSACIECTQYTLFNRQRVINAFLDQATLEGRRAAGYVIDDPDVSAPSVYALNLRSAGLLITELLNFVCGFRPTATMISESWRHGRFQRSDRMNFPEQPSPECPICNFYAGAADTDSLPRPWAEQCDKPVTFFSDSFSNHFDEEIQHG